MKDNKITKCYFQIPLVCNFMSDVIKQHIIKKADRSTDKTRIHFFSNNIERYKYLLELLQRRTRWKMTSLLMSWWKPLKQASFILILIINAFFLMGYRIYDDYQDDTTFHVKTSLL
jgi:hypothetical protein